MPIGTPVHDRTFALCESLNYREWSGYYAVSAYESHHEHEYNAIRNAAAIIDISPLFKYAVTGRDAARLVNRVITRDVGRMAAGQVYYTPWCEEDGTVIDDGTVARLGEDRFHWTAADPNLRWLSQNAAGMDVVVDDVSEETAAVARYRRNFGPDSSVTAGYTFRDEDGINNHGFGLDYRHQGKRWGTGLILGLTEDGELGTGDRINPDVFYRDGPLFVTAGWQRIAPNFLQGSIQTTNRNTDMAVQGDGFFVLANGTDRTYSRAGSFTLDADGKLVDTATGFKVQGANGDITVSLGSQSVAVATTAAPQAMASSTGKPKPSWSDGNANTVAPAYRAWRSDSATGPMMRIALAGTPAAAASTAARVRTFVSGSQPTATTPHTRSGRRNGSAASARYLATALSSITAAIVGVILNLAVWFGLHVVFAEVGEWRGAGLRLLIPDIASLDVAALVLSVAALLAIFRFGVGMLKVLGACALAGVVLSLL